MNRQTPLLVGIAFVVIAVLVFFFVVSPKMGDVNEAQDQLDQARQEQVDLEAELARLQATREEAPQLRRELARLRQRVPPVADLPGLINLLQDAADVSGVDFFSVSPGDPAAVTGATGAAEVPAEIQVIGGFFQVDEFLFRLETLRRAAKVVSINVGEGPDQAPQLSVQMSARFYTTDTDAGPGAAPAPAPSPTPSPSPGASPAPEATPGATPGTTPSPGAIQPSPPPVPTPTPGV